jgi:ADP-ribosylglycohydrolase
MKHPNPNMLLRIAQGDAFCAATEYLEFPRDQAVKDEALRFRKFGQNPKHLDLKPGWYTDDTQMSCAVAEVLISGQPYTREKFTDAFVRCFKRDERKGYSQGFQVFLESISSGEEFLAKINPDSDKNGAAMRAVPLGVLPTVEEVLAVAEVQAKLTHDTPDGILSAQAVALMSHYALYEEDSLADLVAYVEAHLPRFFEVSETIPWNSLVSSCEPVTGPRVGMKTAMAVMDLLLEERDLMGVLQRTIEWGGDTDSVAAIAWGIASTRMSEAVPEFLETQLEPGRPGYGVDFLKSLGASLMSVV